MPLFRRARDARHPAEAAVSPPNAARRGEDRDWRAFDEVAPTYGSVLERITEPGAADLVGLLQVPEGARVLDVGTGTGAAARHAVAAAGSSGVVVGVDPSPAMLREAAARAPGVRLAASTSIDLPFHDGAFDRLSASFVIGYFPDYRTALFELLRVLKPGGRAGFTTWAPDEDDDAFHTAWTEVQEEFAEHEMLVDAHDRAIPWEERFSDGGRLKDALHEAGLRDIWIEGRSYRVEVTAEEYLASREISSTGRFLRQMLGEELWPAVRRRAREVFAERFPPRFRDFHQVLLAVGHKP